MSEEQSQKKKKSARPVGGITQWTQFGSEDDQENGILTEQETSKTVDREASTIERQDTSMPVEQQTRIPVKQDDSKLLEQQASIPVFIKGTYYITPEHDMKLERIRLARRGRGQKIDKSALIREAIDLLSKSEG